jgi:hypothetical protein
MCPAVAVNHAVTEPCVRCRVTVAGRVRRGLLLVNVTRPSELPEALIVQVVDVAEVRVAGEQETEDISVEARAILAAAETPL